MTVAGRAQIIGERRQDDGQIIAVLVAAHQHAGLENGKHRLTENGQIGAFPDFHPGRHAVNQQRGRHGNSLGMALADTFQLGHQRIRPGSHGRAVELIGKAAERQGIPAVVDAGHMPVIIGKAQTRQMGLFQRLNQRIIRMPLCKELAESGERLQRIIMVQRRTLMPQPVRREALFHQLADAQPAMQDFIQKRFVLKTNGNGTGSALMPQHMVVDGGLNLRRIHQFGHRAEQLLIPALLLFRCKQMAAGPIGAQQQNAPHAFIQHLRHHLAVALAMDGKARIMLGIKIKIPFKESQRLLIPQQRARRRRFQLFRRQQAVIVHPRLVKLLPDGFLAAVGANEGVGRVEVHAVIKSQLRRAFRAGKPVPPAGNPFRLIAEGVRQQAAVPAGLFQNGRIVGLVGGNQLANLSGRCIHSACASLWLG